VRYWHFLGISLRLFQWNYLHPRARFCGHFFKKKDRLRTRKTADFFTFDWRLA
jgi:hypothetical protein